MFKVGDEVVDLLYGEGKVIEVDFDDADNYVLVEFEFKDKEYWYTKEGKYPEAKNISLFHKGMVKVLQSEPRILEGWLNIYPDGFADIIHATKEIATISADENLVHTHHLVVTLPEEWKERPL